MEAPRPIPGSAEIRALIAEGRAVRADGIGDQSCGEDHTFRETDVGIRPVEITPCQWVARELDVAHLHALTYQHVFHQLLRTLAVVHFQLRQSRQGPQHHGKE